MPEVVEARALEAWLQAYGRAWEEKAPDAVTELFTEDATYRETPFDKVMRGRDEIRDYWQEIPDTQDDITFGSEILHVVSDTAYVHWWSEYTRIHKGDRIHLDGVFILEFEGDLCSSLREWWHMGQP